MTSKKYLKKLRVCTENRVRLDWPATTPDVKLRVCADYPRVFINAHFFHDILVEIKCYETCRL
jgi:hypothetical protein